MTNTSSGSPSPYNPESLRRHLQTSLIGRRIEMHEQVVSTNDLAKEAGRKGEPEGLLIVAEEQVAGRGRLGRVWVAPPGCCVLCSVLLRPSLPAQQAFYLTIAAALAIYRATAHVLASAEKPDPHPASQYALHTKQYASIKWPNDVLVRGRKIAGILCETEFGGSGLDFAVVGFGINANLSAEDLGDLSPTATSLSLLLGYSIDRTLLLARVLEELEDLYLSLQSGEFAVLHGEWTAALETIGKRVSVREGPATIVGQAVRVDPDGALVVRQDSGIERRVLAGDVAPQS